MIHLHVLVKPFVHYKIVNKTESFAELRLYNLDWKWEDKNPPLNQSIDQSIELG